MLDRARESGVGRFVYCSSIGALGKKPPKPTDESTECRPEDIYQRTKKAAEELCLDYRARTGFPIAIVRPAEVYGPRDRRLLKLFRALKKGTFAMIGGGRNEHHLVYIDDMVQGFLLAAEKEEALGEIFIIAGEESATSQAMAESVCRALGVTMPRWRIPLTPVWTAAWLVEAACRPFGIQPPIYPRRVDFFRADFRFDISKARTVLGYRPETGLDEGVRKTLEWYRSRSLL
jgi:nucleoside-diphosphate-sugar epimerase